MWKKGARKKAPLIDEKWKNGASTSRCKALAFLPVEKINAAFEDIRENLPDQASAFATYFENTFIRGKELRTMVRTGKVVYAPARYTLNEWNVYAHFEEDLERTTNSQEALNRRLQCCNFNGDHPTLFRLASLLMNFSQRVTHHMQQHIIEGAPMPKKKKVSLEKEKRMTLLYRKYRDNELTLEDYLFGCSGNLL